MSLIPIAGRVTLTEEDAKVRAAYASLDRIVWELWDHCSVPAIAMSAEAQVGAPVTPRMVWSAKQRIDRTGRFGLPS